MAESVWGEARGCCVAGEGLLYDALHEHRVERFSVWTDEECFRACVTGVSCPDCTVVVYCLCKFAAEWYYPFLITLSEHLLFASRKVYIRIEERDQLCPADSCGVEHQDNEAVSDLGESSDALRHCVAVVYYFFHFPRPDEDREAFRRFGQGDF